MTQRTAVKFRTPDGLALFGILDLPDPATRREVAIVLLSPGVKMRVAPHRLYLKLAERFVQQGFPVFRFDYHGLGDAEGELEENVLIDVYNSILDGRYVADTEAALDWLEKTHGFRRVILGGLCGGALSGLLTAQQDERVRGLLAIGIPASYEGSGDQHDEFLTRGQLKSLSYGYVRKLLQLKALWRFVTLQSSYRVIWRSFRERFAPEAKVSPTPKTRIPVGNYNRKFGPAFFDMVQTGRPILLMFGGADRWRWEFDEKFEERLSDKLAPYHDWYEKHVIPQANHILSEDEWLETAINLSEAWLGRAAGA